MTDIDYLITKLAKATKATEATIRATAVITYHPSTDILADKQMATIKTELKKLAKRRPAPEPIEAIIAELAYEVRVANLKGEL